MKNILMTITTILMMVLIIILMVNGLAIGNFKILSIADIKTESKEIDNSIETLNTKKNIDYKKSLSDLDKAVKDLNSSKEAYLDIASVSSDAEIKAANQSQTYTMDFLWNKVGRYATQEGLKLKWEVNSTGVENKNNLNFTVVGTYIGIINYISNLENDSELLFNIENFKIEPDSSVNDLKATFKVSNISIKQETTVNSISSSANSESTTTTDNTTTSTNNTTTENSSSINSNSTVDVIEETVGR